MATVFISLGSNLGSRLANCLEALERLASPAIILEKVSPWFLSEPLGPPQPWFVNGAVQVQTHLSPFTLLARLQEIEKSMGRTGKGTGGPRTIDLDIIVHGEWILDTPWLTLPHPRFRERRFVLEPMASLAPGTRDPQTGLTFWELLQACKDPCRVIPLQTGKTCPGNAWRGRPGPPGRLPRAFWCR